MANKFWSDAHWNHNNIIKYSNRPFANTEEMNEYMFNSLSMNFDKSKDFLYYLGDLSFGSMDKVKSIYNRIMDICDGQISFILGNHDHYLKHIINTGRDYLEIQEEGIDIVLFHYPIEEWNGKHKGALHYYGHCHKNLDTDIGTNRFHVGCDGMGYAPLTTKQIIERINTRNAKGNI